METGETIIKFQPIRLLDSNIESVNVHGTELSVRNREMFEIEDSSQD